MGVTRIIILIVAAGAAVVTLLLMRSFLSDAGSQAEARPTAATVPTVEVLVAAENLPRGSRISASNLKWQAWPEDAVSASYISRTSQPDAIATYENAIVRTDLTGGEPVNPNKVVRLDGSGFMAAMIEPGMRAVSTEISPETGAGGFILPNDHVDVIVAETKQTRRGDDYVSTRTILENVRVLAIDQTYRQSEEGEQVAVGSTATLELSPRQMEQLTLAQAVGEISLALRSLADSGPNAQDIVRDDSRGLSMRVFRYGAESNVFVESAE